MAAARGWHLFDPAGIRRRAGTGLTDTSGTLVFAYRVAAHLGAAVGGCDDCGDLAASSPGRHLMFRRARRALLLATAGTVVLTVAVPAVSAQAYSVGNYYKLVNYGSTVCAEIAAYNTQLDGYHCGQGVDSQKWLLESSSDAGEYKFHNQLYGGCITDEASGKAWDDLCAGGENTQRFALQSTSRSGYYKVVAESDGKCLTDSTSDGYIYFQSCAQGYGYQYWELQAAS